MSFTFSTIPLDCLALSCQHLTETRDLISIHSTNRHWRYLLIHLDKYSHSLLSCGHAVHVEWHNDDHDADDDGDTKLTDIEQQQQQQQQRQQQQQQKQLVDLMILPGLQLAFRHLRVLTYHFTSSCVSIGNKRAPSKKLMKQVEKMRNGLYTLLTSLTSIEHLALTDTVKISNITEMKDNMVLPLMSIDNIGQAMKHITTLITFHYQSCWQEKVTNHEKYDDHGKTIPVILMNVLCQCTKLRAIGGNALLRCLTLSQWSRLFYSLPHIECIGGAGDGVGGNGTVIHALLGAAAALSSSSSSSSSSTSEEYISSKIALQAIRTLKMLPRLREESDIIQIDRLGLTQVRTLGIEMISPRTDALRTFISQFTQLRELSFNIGAIRELNYSFINMAKSLVHLHQLELSEIVMTSTANDLAEDKLINPFYTQLQWLRKFLAGFESLRCLILANCRMNDITLGGMISACTRLIELRMRNSCIAELTATRLNKLVKLHSNLRLLRIHEILISTRPPNVYLIPADLITISPQRCGLMLQYSERISWLDLMTLTTTSDRTRISALISASQPRTSPKPSSSSSSIALSQGHEHQHSFFITYQHSTLQYASPWHSDWMRLQDLKRLDSEMKHS